MALTQEEIKEFKAQLKSQVSHLPPDKKTAALQQIDALSPQALEAMIKQQQHSHDHEKTIFRMIINKDVDSVEVGENSSALAVLDINPISKGHIMIIPKNPVHDPAKMPEMAQKLAMELEKKIISKLKAKSVKIELDMKFGEAILNLIPIYAHELNKDSPRKKADPKDLMEVKNLLEMVKIDNKPEVVKIRKKRGRKPQVLKLKRRIP